MALITKMRRQNCVYWGTPSPDGFGSYTYDTPTEINCRWEDRAELFVTPLGEEAVSQSRVFVDRDVDIGGYLQLTTLESNTPDSPIGVNGAYVIRQFNKIPNLKNTLNLR